MRKFRVSIRLKMLFVISAVLLLSMGTYLYLATTLFTRDKLAYVYDLNASLVETISEQTNSNLSVLVRSLHLFARDILQAELSEEQRSSYTAELFAREPDILRIEIFEAGTDSGSISRRDAFVNQSVVDELQLSAEDLDQMRKDYPLPLEAMLKTTSEVYVQNSSLQPEAAIVTIAYGDKASSVVIAADFRRHHSSRSVYGEHFVLPVSDRPHTQASSRH